MILPIIAYGHPILRQVSPNIDKDYPGLKELISDIFETMYDSNGVGLAAPQVNRSIRLIVVDASPYATDHPEVQEFKKVFINAKIINEWGDEWTFNEGCLSIPDIREDVTRHSKIRIQYQDEDFNFHDDEYEGVAARIIQHEYDHLEGILFVDRISSLRKTLLKRKLYDISKGDIDVKYKMIFPVQKKKMVYK
ncbi:MAG: peptide deformylase [Bacteroidetes bacterium]|nr:peptide deformylase [Bacteroidota bacterium]